MVILRSADEFLVRAVSLADDSFGVNCCLTGFEDDAVSVLRAVLSPFSFEGTHSYTGGSIGGHPRPRQRRPTRPRRRGMRRGPTDPPLFFGSLFFLN